MCRKGPLPAVKASGPHRELPHPVLLPTFSTVQKGTNIEIASHVIGKASPKYNQAPVTVSGGFHAPESLGAVAKITPGKKRTGSEAGTQASISRTTLWQTRCSRTPFNFTASHFPSLCEMVIRKSNAWASYLIGSIWLPLWNCLQGKSGKRTEKV